MRDSLVFCRLKKPLPLDVALSFGRCNTSLNLANAQRKGKQQGQDEGSCGKAEFMRISGAFPVTEASTL